jgi:TonB family protein
VIGRIGKRRAVLASLALASLGVPAFAQETDQESAAPVPAEASELLNSEPSPAPMTAAELKEAGGTLPKIVDSSEEVPGLKALQARGIQGQIVVEFVIQSDGSLTDGKIAAPSQSPELDQVALELIDEFVAEPALDAEGEPVAVIARMPLNFWKDSIANGTLREKTCADFVIDADWFLNANPEGSVDDMRVWTMTVGLFVIGNPTEDIAERFKSAPRPDPDELYAYCTRKPKTMFLKAFRKVG